MANNKSKSLQAYETRLFYKYAFLYNKDNVIDFWSNHKYYGILDNKSTPVYLNKQYLKAISTPSANNQINKQSVLNIVSDSFSEFIQEIKNADSSLSIAKSIFNPINVKKSTLLFETEYLNYLRQVLSIWYDQNKNIIDNDVSTFEEFISLFVNTIVSTSKSIITQSAYLTSYLSSPLVTGLAIEISNEKHDEDNKKIANYIADSNFAFFSNTAAKYGFLIDKNAPWRLIYNLSTQYAVEKMNKYNVNNIDELFSKFYVYPHLSEFKTIRDELIRFYEIRIKNKPSYQKTKYCSKTKGLIFETIIKQADTKKEDLFWIQLYYFLRCREEQIEMNQTQFNNELSRIGMLYSSFGESATLEWIKDKTKKFLDGGTNPTYNQYKSVMANKSNNSLSYAFLM